MMRVCRLSVDVCLSRTSGLSREQRSVYRKTKIGKEVAHVTCDSDTTFKVKRSKVKRSRSRGRSVLRRKMSHIFVADKDVAYWQIVQTVLVHILQVAHKWAWPRPGWRDPFSKFRNALNISQTVKATLFKYDTQVQRGQLLPTDHKLTPTWA